MRLRWALYYHPSVTSFLYSLREGAAVLTPIWWSLQDNPTPETAQLIPGRLGRYEIQVGGYVIQVEVVIERKIVKVVLVERA